MLELEGGDFQKQVNPPQPTALSSLSSVLPTGQPRKVIWGGSHRLEAGGKGISSPLGTVQCVESVDLAMALVLTGSAATDPFL